MVNRVVSGEIYTAGKNFTLLPGVMGWINLTSDNYMILFHYTMLSLWIRCHIPTPLQELKLGKCPRAVCSIWAAQIIIYPGGYHDHYYIYFFSALAANVGARRIYAIKVKVFVILDHLNRHMENEVWPRFQSFLKLLPWTKGAEWVKVLDALGPLCHWQNVCFMAVKARWGSSIPYLIQFNIWILPKNYSFNIRFNIALPKIQFKILFNSK